MVMVLSCPLCKARRFCIHKSYPFPKPDIEKEVQSRLRKEVFGPSSSVFVGKKGYPDVLAGPMIGLEAHEHMDSPSQWFGMEYGKIIEMRSFLLRAKKPEHIHSRSRFTEEMQELALARKPADVEMHFKKIPSFSFRLSEQFQPMGPSATIEKMRVAENVRIQQKVERIVADDLRSNEQTMLLFKTGLDVYKLSSILSSGALGTLKAKKLVPTRWSVTGIDDIIAKGLMREIREYPSVSEYHVFESSFMDNHFVIVVMPGNWEFENFEVWASAGGSLPTQSRIMAEYEPFEGRSKYAEKQAGGYYASRISVVRYLRRIKRQGRVVCFREVGEGYRIPLGVWVVRETAGHAFKNGRRFATEKEALAYAENRLRVPLNEYRKASTILAQKRLWDF